MSVSMVIVAILSSEGFHLWDGQLVVMVIRPLQMAKDTMVWGVVGFTKHGYHLWDKATQSVSRLPVKFPEYRVWVLLPKKYCGLIGGSFVKRSK